MSSNKQKLELTWIGKNNPEYDIANIEPRILEENPELSNCANDPNTENMIIHGDNLLALKALLPEYEGNVKCIYIDPPYNTGNAFEHYDDSVEHSTWLSLMKPRLELLRMLLSDEGVIYVQIDYIEQAYLKILMDEIFNRKNFIQMVSIKTATPSGFKVANPGPVNVTENILIYSKNRDTYKYKKMFVPCDFQKDYSNFIINPADEVEKWQIGKIMDVVFENLGVATASELKNKFGDASKPIVEKMMAEFAKENADRVFATYGPHKPSGVLKKMIEESRKERGRIFHHERSGDEPFYVLNGRLFAFYSKKLKMIDGEITPTQMLTDFWGDLSWDSLSNEGGVDFKNSKKPEFLIKRIVEMSTDKDDFVLDSFLGSGTTAAVAHKMGRKYIGIEMGEHAYTHCKVRLDKVIDGSDQGGISKTVEWKGGGAYKFYELAPSFIVKDEFGNPVIDNFYNDTKLIKAMCKLMNFTYQPSQSQYWKHGIGQGKNYLYITTQLLTSGMVQQIAVHLADGESLIICPKKFEPGADKIDNRITIKKIPQSILKACYFGKKEYLLPIKESALEEVENETEDEE